MTLLNKLSFILASLFLVLAINQARATTAFAQECVTVYGGQVCGSHTPVDTDLPTESLYSISAILYSTGLASFVLSKRFAA